MFSIHLNSSSRVNRWSKFWKFLTTSGSLIQVMTWSICSGRSIVSLRFGMLFALHQKLCNRFDVFQKHAAISPLVVVPGENFYQATINNGGHRQIHQGTV